MPPGRPKRFDPAAAQREKLRLDEELELERVDPPQRMSIATKAKAVFSTYTAYRRGCAVGEQVVTKQWDAAKSVGKANQAAVGTAQGTMAGAGGVAAALAMIRAMKPDMLPWDVESDKLLVAASAVLIGPLWAWLKTFTRDKLKHGG